MPKKDSYIEDVKAIVTKRERSLYVDFKDSKLNIPTHMNPADAVEEINRASKSIESETAFEKFELLLHKKILEIRSQK